MLVMIKVKPRFFFAVLTASACKDHWAYTAAQNSNLGIYITNKLKKTQANI